MLEKRREVAEQVAATLFAAESAIDAAIAKTAVLAGVIPAVREEASLAAAVGQDAIERAIETLKTLGEARRLIVKTHEELATTHQRIGLGTYASGTWKDEEPVGLRLAATRAA